MSAPPPFTAEQIRQALTVLHVMQGMSSSGVGTTKMAAPAPRSRRPSCRLELGERGEPDRVHTTRLTTPSSDAMIDNSPAASPLLADGHLPLDQPTTPTSASSNSSAFSSASSIARRVNNLQMVGDYVNYDQFNMPHSQALPKKTDPTKVRRCIECKATMHTYHNTCKNSKYWCKFW